MRGPERHGLLRPPRGIGLIIPFFISHPLLP